MDFIQLQKINVAIGTALGWHNFILNDEYGPDRALKPGQKAELNCYFTDLPNFYEILISNGEDKRDAERYRWLRSKGLKFIDFESLSYDTGDTGLDYAVDTEIEKLNALR